MFRGLSYKVAQICLQHTSKAATHIEGHVKALA